MTTDDEQSRVEAATRALQQVLDRMSPAERTAFDAAAQKAMIDHHKRHRRMEEAVIAVRVLHRDATGDKAGFCAECGNVSPCQTRRFLEPFA